MTKDKEANLSKALDAGRDFALSVCAKVRQDELVIGLVAQLGGRRRGNGRWWWWQLLEVKAGAKGVYARDDDFGHRAASTAARLAQRCDEMRFDYDCVVDRQVRRLVRRRVGQRRRRRLDHVVVELVADGHLQLDERHGDAELAARRAVEHLELELVDERVVHGHKAAEDALLLEVAEANVMHGAVVGAQARLVREQHEVLEVLLDGEYVIELVEVDDEAIGGLAAMRRVVVATAVGVIGGRNGGRRLHVVARRRARVVERHTIERQRLQIDDDQRRRQRLRSARVHEREHLFGVEARERVLGALVHAQRHVVHELAVVAIQAQTTGLD